METQKVNYKKFIQFDTIVFCHRLIKYLNNWQYADTDA